MSRMQWVVATLVAVAAPSLRAHTGRRVRSATVAILVIVALGVGLAPPVAAAPSEPLPARLHAVAAAKPTYKATGTFSDWTYRFQGAVTCAGGTVRNGNQSDYRKWSKCFTDRKINAKDRRKASAGFWDGGGKFTHISKTSLRAIGKYRLFKVRWGTGADPRGVRTASGCTGEQYTYEKHVVGGDHNREVWQYFNACDVNKVIDNVDWMSWACGVWVGALPGRVGIGMGIGCVAWWRVYRNWWTQAQRASTTDSVYTVSKYETRKNANGRHKYSWAIYPQSPR